MIWNFDMNAKIAMLGASTVAENNSMMAQFNMLAAKYNASAQPIGATAGDYFFIAQGWLFKTVLNTTQKK